MYIITTFSLVYLTEWFGHFGLWFITIPVTVGFLWGIAYFEKLEQEASIFPKRKNTNTENNTRDNAAYTNAVSLKST